MSGLSLALVKGMSDLEIQLTEVLVKLVVRYPDGWERIQSALESVYEAGEELDR